MSTSRQAWGELPCPRTAGDAGVSTHDNLTARSRLSPCLSIYARYGTGSRTVKEERPADVAAGGWPRRLGAGGAPPPVRLAVGHALPRGAALRWYSGPAPDRACPA